MNDFEFTVKTDALDANGKVVLVQLTGDVGKGLYTIIPPEEVKLEALVAF